MRAAPDLIKKYGIAMKAAYEAEDSVSFLEGGYALKKIAGEAVAGGFIEIASAAFQALSDSLKIVRGFRPDEGLPGRGAGRRLPFIASIMPLFGVNGPESALNLGLTPEIDDYLLSEKINFESLGPTLCLSSIMAHCMRKGLLDKVEQGYASACAELLRQQLEAKPLADSQKRDIDCLQYVMGGYMVRAFEAVHDQQMTWVSFGCEFDEQLATVLRNCESGTRVAMTESRAKGMQMACLSKSLEAAILISRSFNFDMNEVELLNHPSLEVAARMLVMNCKSTFGPQLVQKMAEMDPGLVDAEMHQYLSKDYEYQPMNLIRSCSGFIESDGYKSHHQDLVVVLLENACAKINRGLQPKSKDYEVFRDYMTRAGIPDSIQFKIRVLQSNKNKLIELDLGV
ncbi:hypothetical protein [Pseudomonas putida]|uniref:Uncharacterized protein n=1 Tax=Pseudomonas putida TaxID=303 RepID=A0A8I1EGQ9_PSEPU|nr:hypothetical protein [Pseudomonas putida]MBI6885777.1 hypothetical protein [Pseudomonas putida]